MLREQVIVAWNNLKPKIQTSQLSENDKRIWNYLANDSKLANFLLNANLVENHDLDRLEKEYQEISDKISNLELEENDLVIDFWVNASSFVSLVLDWISLKKSLWGYYQNDWEPTIEEVD